MEWNQYLGQLSQILVLRNREPNAMEILKELDGFHQEAAEDGKSDADFIAELGTPETAAGDPAERGRFWTGVDWRFWAGVGLIAAFLAGMYTGYKRQPFPAVWTAVGYVLVSLALIWLFRIRVRVLPWVLLGAKGKGRSWDKVLGLLLVLLLLGFILSFVLWIGLATEYRMMVGPASRVVYHLLNCYAAVGLGRGVLAVSQCRADGFPSCCYWLGLLCAQRMVMAPLWSMDNRFPALSITQQFLLYEIPAMGCLVLTLVVTVALGLWLRRVERGVRAQWTHS